jgi:hypothetical protein
VILAHLGHGPWTFLLIAFLYLSLAAGIGVGMMIGRRNQRGPRQDAVVRRIHSS